MNEQFINIGEILRSLRVYKGIEIEDLAKGVCSEEELLLMEKNELIPNINQLLKLADNLNVQITDFFNFATAGSINYVSAVTDLINRYKRDRNYSAIHKIIENEKENPLFAFPIGQQFLIWHEAICLYYLSDPEERDEDHSIQLLEDAIKITNPSGKRLSEREIEIKMSIALIRKDHLAYEDAIIILKEIIDDIDQLPQLSDPKVRLRALFGLAQSLTKINKFEESLIYSEKGIKQCINDELLYLFGEFYYQSAVNYVQIGNIEKGKDCLTKSQQIFTLQQNKKLAEVVLNELENLP